MTDVNQLRLLQDVFGSTQLRAPKIQQPRIDMLVLVSSFSNIVRPSVEFTAKSNPGNFREIGIFLLNSSDKGYGNGLNQDS